MIFLWYWDYRSNSCCRREYWYGEVGGMSIMVVIVLSTACCGLACLHSTRLHSAESTACFCIDGTPMTPIINIPSTSPHWYSLIWRNESMLQSVDWTASRVAHCMLLTGLSRFHWAEAEYGLLPIPCMEENIDKVESAGCLFWGSSGCSPCNSNQSSETDIIPPSIPFIL